LQQLISSAASQNTLKAANKQKLLFTSLSDKLLFQQAAVVPNRAVVGEICNFAALDFGFLLLPVSMCDGTIYGSQGILTKPTNYNGKIANVSL
jgi:hypothetical protein